MVKKKKKLFAIICIGNFISFYPFLNLKVETNQNPLTQVVCVFVLCCVCVCVCTYTYMYFHIYNSKVRVKNRLDMDKTQSH